MCLAKYNDTFKNKYGLLFKKNNKQLFRTVFSKKITRLLTFFKKQTRVTL